MMTFAQFQATRRWSPDLTQEGLDLGFDDVAPGFLYEGGLHIFAGDGGASRHLFGLVIANTESARRTSTSWNASCSPGASARA
jgi:hypothetical protein